MTEVVVGILSIAAVALAFFVSAAAGLGGSLILVPTLALLLGTKEGVALAALLLAGNNFVKLVAYRGVVPVRRSSIVIGAMIIGAFFGARLLIAARESLVVVAVLVSFAIALMGERWDGRVRRRVMAPGLALASGATSGFSGTSGPLKGISIRSLALDRLHTVGAAALVSFVGDATKVAVFTDARLLTGSSYGVAALAIPIMIAATYAGRRFNTAIGERGYQRLFWAVMAGYTARLLSAVA